MPASVFCQSIFVSPAPEEFQDTYLKSPNKSTRYMFRRQSGFVENIFLYKNVRNMLRFFKYWLNCRGGHSQPFVFFCKVVLWLVLNVPGCFCVFLKLNSIKTSFHISWRPLYNTCAGQRWLNTTVPDRKTSFQIYGNILLKLIKYIII